MVRFEERRSSSGADGLWRAPAPVREPSHQPGTTDTGVPGCLSSASRQPKHPGHSAVHGAGPLKPLQERLLT